MYSKSGLASVGSRAYLARFRRARLMNGPSGEESIDAVPETHRKHLCLRSDIRGVKWLVIGMQCGSYELPPLFMGFDYHRCSSKKRTSRCKVEHFPRNRHTRRFACFFFAVRLHYTMKMQHIVTGSETILLDTSISPKHSFPDDREPTR